MNNCACQNCTVLKYGRFERGKTSFILYTLVMVNTEIYKPLHLKPSLSPFHPPQRPGRGRKSKAAQIVILIASPPWCLTSCQFFFCNSAHDCSFLSLHPHRHQPLAHTWTVSTASEPVFPHPSPSFSSESTDTSVDLQDDIQNCSVGHTAALIESLSWLLKNKKQRCLSLTLSSIWPSASHPAASMTH